MKKNKVEQKRKMAQILSIFLIISLLVGFIVPLIALFN